MFTRTLIKNTYKNPSIKNGTLKYVHNLKLIDNLNKTTENSLTEFELGLKYIRGMIGSPIFFMWSKVVKKNHVVTLYRFGKPDGYMTEGLNFELPGYSYTTHFCGDITSNSNNMHITDKNGNPIVVSTFITYNIINPVNNYINLMTQNKENEKEKDDGENYIKNYINNHNDNVNYNENKILTNWFEKIIRNEISKYTYDEITADAKICDKLVNIINMNEKSEHYGIEVSNVGILQINYAKEIAELMLVKQRINATLNARKEISEATINMIEDISVKLDNKLTQKDKSKLIRCLTVAMIGGQVPTAVINID
jgi:regulator of protease activity HflC (stomatin/prohibitin superfamily)